MYRFLFGVTFLISLAAFADVHPTVQKPEMAVWTFTTPAIHTPESVYYDPQTKLYFVSNVIGSPGEKDKQGTVDVIDFKNGKPVKLVNVVKGLNAPKGMRAHKGILWVSDLDTLIAIDINQKKISKRIPIKDAQFLNDIAIDKAGKVYVSDMVASKIYVVENGKPTVFMEGDNLESPNGLLINGDTLYVAAWGRITDPATFGVKTPGNLLAIDVKKKTVTPITKAPLGNLDGLEQAQDGGFVVSDWVAGKVYKVAKDGSSYLVAEGFKNAADIGLVEDLLIVPDMGKNVLYGLEFAK